MAEKSNVRENEPIAIIGMGCRFPGGANDPYIFWENLKNGKDCITEVPPNRYGTNSLYSAYKDKTGKTITKWGGYIDGFDEFDPAFFGISPREAQYMDPQQRKLLEVTWEALEDGGQKPGELAGKEVGVFIGAFTVDYKIIQFGDLSFDNLVAHTSTGVMMTMVSNRISYIFDFKGPSLSIDTACSSSLVAIHLACESLKKGECCMAVAGGTLLHATPQYTIAESKGGFLSPHGWSHAFDASADGYVRAEGVGVIILKRLSDALQDGDPIHALVRGSGVNQDGHTNGITVPNPKAQIKLIEGVYAKAGIQPGEVQYVEAHGTGTPVGDPIEANALGQVLGMGRKPGAKCFIGSVKTNIGHTESAAGIAGVIKTVMSLKNRQIPPHLHLKKINPKIEIGRWPYEIPVKLEPWPEHEGPAMAGVNSFGFGGTNAHVILQEAPQKDRAALEKKADAVRPRILAITAGDGDALRDMAQNYRDVIADEKGLSLNDIGYTLGVKKENLNEKLSLVYSSKNELIERLDKYIGGESDPLVFKGTGWEADRKRLVWVFTGMGPQWWAMGRELFEKEPVYREMIERCDREMSKLVDWSLLKELNADEKESRMAETWLSQPANFALQVALAALWRSFGIRPDAIIGHSTGEVAAFYEAGVYSFEDAVRVIIHRSRLQQKVSGTGKMMAAGIPADEAEALIAGCGDKVSIAAVNSPRSLTLSGDEGVLAELAKVLEDREVFCKFLQVQIPFHSACMDPIKEELLASLKDIRPGKAFVLLYSTAKGRIVEGGELDAAYWWENVRGTVLFARAVDCLLEDGYSLFLEVGPHPVLGGSISECMAAGQKTGKILYSLKRKEKEQETLVSSLAELLNMGLDINWEAFYPGGRFVRMPRYAWKKGIYWAEPPLVGQIRLDKTDHPLLGRRLWVAEPAWEIKLDIENNPYLADHKIQGNVVFPAAGYIEMAFSALNTVLGRASYSLEGLELRKALFLPEDEFKRVQFLLDLEQSSFKIVTYQDDGSHSSILHAAGRVGMVQSSRVEDKGALSALKQRLKNRTESSVCYEKLHKMGYEYGPCFQGIKEIHIGPGEALACIRLPEQITSASEYHFHPTLLDACFQALIAASEDFGGAAAGEVRGGIRLPVLMEQLRLDGGEVRELWAYARLVHEDADRIKGDITLYDENGTVKGQIRGFTAQVVDKAAGHAAAGTIDNWLYEIDWLGKDMPEEKATEGVGDTRKGEWIVLADKQGLGRELASLLEEKGDRCRLIYPEEGFGREGMLDSKGIIHLWNLDAPRMENLTTEDMEQMKGVGCHSLLSTAKAAAESGFAGRLWIVTRGAQAVGRNIAGISCTAAPAWGMGRVLMHQELVENRGKLIDLDLESVGAEALKKDASRVLAEILSQDGEDEIAFRGDKRHVSRLNRAKNLTRPLPTRLRADGCYLVTGAFGALGKILCRMLIEHGARRLILMSRTAVPARSDWPSISKDSSMGRTIEFIRELEAMGAGILTASVDITDEEQLTGYIREFKRMGYPPIRGVFHSAGVVKDVLVSKMDTDTFDDVYRPKVLGSYLLHKCLKEEPLDYFVLFSSVASVLTTAGQTNYAAGNAFEDALAHYRRALGLPALSINWGPWTVGMVKELNLVEYYRSKRGMESLQPETGMDILDRLLGQDLSQVVVAPIVDWPVTAAWYPVIPALVRDILNPGRDTANGMTAQEKKKSDVVVKGREGQEYSDIEVKLSQIWADVLGLQEVDIYKSFYTLGGDSMLAARLLQKVQKEYPGMMDITDMFAHSSIHKMAEHIEKKLKPAAETEPQKAAQAPAEPENINEVLGKLAQGEISVEEVDALLNWEAKE